MKNPPIFVHNFPPSKSLLSFYSFKQYFISQKKKNPL